MSNKMAWLLDYYKNNQESAFLNIWVYAFFSTAAFGGQLISHKGWAFFVGTSSIVLVTVHGYLHQKVKIVSAAELEFWKLKSKRYSWLLSSIRSLITRKRNSIEKRTAESRVVFSGESIIKNLHMLYEFYTHYDDSMLEAVSFRVAFFVPRSDGVSLTAKFHHYADGKAPHYCGDEIRESDIFHREKSQTLAVKAWNTKNIEIAETPDKITYMYQGQKKYIQSMIAYPILSDGHDRVVGVITVCADKPEFFREEDVKKHEEYIGEFALRISLELARLEHFEADERKGAA